MDWGVSNATLEVRAQMPAVQQLVAARWPNTALLALHIAVYACPAERLRGMQGPVRTT